MVNKWMKKTRRKRFPRFLDFFFPSAILTVFVLPSTTMLFYLRKWLPQACDLCSIPFLWFPWPVFIHRHWPKKKRIRLYEGSDLNYNLEDKSPSPSIFMKPLKGPVVCAICFSQGFYFRFYPDFTKSPMPSHSRTLPCSISWHFNI